MHRFRDEREKIICPIFASLRTAARCALVGLCDGLIENVHRAPPAARGIRDDTEQEPKNLVVQPSSLGSWRLPIAVDKQGEVA
jgi:hypothetical protein